MAEHEETMEGTPAPRRKPARHEEKSSLNITSLMDAISIILTYLLVSINMDPWNVKQNQYLTLAQSSVDTEPKDSMAIVVNRQEIVVDSTRAVPVECVMSAAQGARQCRTDKDYEQVDNTYYIDKVYKEDGSEASFLVTELFKQLQDKLQVAREIHSAKGGEGDFKSMATVICDRNIPYRMIAEVVNTMGQAGIEQMRFAIMRGNRWAP